MRRLGTFSAMYLRSLSVSSADTPMSTMNPRPIRPMTWPSTVTEASVTR